MKKHLEVLKKSNASFIIDDKVYRRSRDRQLGEAQKVLLPYGNKVIVQQRILDNSANIS
jgi:hypothetical protein